MTASNTQPSQRLESSIAPHLLVEGRTPRHRPGTYTPPYPSFSARFGEDVTAVVMAYFGVQVADAENPALAAAVAELSGWFGQESGPAHADLGRYVDGEGYTTVIGIAYWDQIDTFDEWFSAIGATWLDPGRFATGIGYFLELVTPSAERFETVFSASDKAEGVACVAPGMSGEIEEHFYWGSTRDRLPASQSDPLYPSGSPALVVDGDLRTVRLGENACLIRSGQDITDTGDRERELYRTDVEPSLVAGMEFLTTEGSSIGCYDNRFMVVLDDDGQPTSRTFGMSWWVDIASLEEWAASHPTHLKIYGNAMRHLSTFGPDTRLRLYHELTVPAAEEARFSYLGCHDRTGMLRAVM